MKSDYTIKRNIPGILKAIQEETQDLNIISKYENIMVSMFASVLLLVASIANFVVRYIIQSQNLKICLFNSLIFLLISIAFEAATRLDLKTNIVTLIISVLSFLTLIFITIAFYNIIGPAIWTVAFIQLMMAMIRVTKTMLYYVIFAIILSNIYILYHFFHSPSFHLNMLYYIVQIVLFMVVCNISAIVYNINTNRYHRINKQFQEVMKKNKLIASSKNEIEHLAYHDNLTGLPNRILLSKQINHSIVLSKSIGKMLAVLFLDLDDFKLVNDTMGHDIGDQLLIEVSKRLANALCIGDTVSRIGGDEFIILIKNAEDIDYINKVSEKILNCFNDSFIVNNQNYFATTSIGVAIYPTDGKNAEELIKNADIAMYKAKEKDKNQYIICNSVMKTKIIETMEMTNSLLQALERNEFELYYQPQLSCISSEILGVEALIRWNHPELGMISPVDFIPIAEKTNLIISIGDWVIRTACKQNKKWQDEGFTPIRMGVNVSVKQFLNGNLVKEVEEILRETGLDCQYLELEITESAVMKGKGNIIETLTIFKNMGIHIAFDDFGTEYSSLNYLKQLPVDRIKIPMTFIQGIGVNTKDEAITKAIIILAKNMGLGVIAEGVETKIQLDFLNQKMCDEIQGYYYYKPMPSNEVEELLRKPVYMI
jgi:diguanylate cyclase (GGDEF)-like protein